MQKNANFALIDAKYGSQMNTQQVRYFLALADELHFWRTSEKVFITQSALSRHIKSLEAELGVLLFERDKRNVKLTDAGEFLKGEFARILTDLESVTRHANQIAAGEVGTIRIGHPASITFSVLPEILLLLAQKHPNVIAQMIEVDAVDVGAALLTHRIDLAFNREVDPSNEFESKMLMTENFALVVSADHRVNRAKKIDLSDLKDEWFVLPSLDGKSEHVAQLKTIFAEAGFEPRVRFESDFGATLLGLVAKGLGISVMPYSYSHYLTEEVRFIKIPATSSLYAIWRAKDGNHVVENLLRVIDSIADRGP
jgi:DNA-binding transcriptional LysR family regulator